MEITNETNEMKSHCLRVLVFALETDTGHPATETQKFHFPFHLARAVHTQFMGRMSIYHDENLLLYLIPRKFAIKRSINLRKKNHKVKSFHRVRAVKSIKILFKGNIMLHIIF